MNKLEEKIKETRHKEDLSQESFTKELEYNCETTIDKIEESAMAVVICNGKILVTNEMIYGNERISLPKGHVEKNETSLETSIRECYEETNIVLNPSNLMTKLTPCSYEFLTPENKFIKKTLIPYLFEVNDFGNPLSKEERIIAVKWMDVEEFLSLCSYENVKKIVYEFLSSKIK